MDKYWNNRIECMKKEELKKLQNKRFMNILKYVYKNVPYYREKLKNAKVKLDNISSINDLYKLPFMTKEDIAKTYPFGLFATPMKNVVRLHTSSGTTGK